MQRWFAVHTHSGAEALAQGNLERQGFTTYLPRWLKTRRHARRQTRIKTPLFPRYLFVRFDPDRTRWRSINGTYGVSHLVRMGGKPSPLPHGVISEIRARENEDGLVNVAERPDFESGEAVRVTTGPFADQSGIFECMDDRQRIVILLGILGREIRVPMPRGSVASFA